MVSSFTSPPPSSPRLPPTTQHRYLKNPTQPSPKWLEDQIANNPHQPLVWAEDQGWFDQWGVAKRMRVSKQL